MVTKVLCWVVLCFLGGDAGVTQTPRHKVTQKGQTVTLRCEPHSNHDTIFWYRQTMVQGLELLVYFNNKLLVDDSGMPKDRFSAAMPEASFSTMKIQPTAPGDSAAYLCASSLATALQNHPVQVQK
uniref:Ig-like domain-containing protein n=1 Tax=Marmota marmota marmota TaxID=9994 RepID=A0A8C5Z4I6_MARMA